ncbi:hypothetical protein GDO81_003322 [Engystomops pustulosus]|uniref:Uncharacterized protein n=1 Tax=Engystomops pustulosus TaxID=76066 RepID=A0AAV7A2S2_ENGPU|nr:hypothetical protein GDO81_003322 [Engystomops pustulosus]
MTHRENLECGLQTSISSLWRNRLARSAVNRKFLIRFLFCQSRARNPYNPEET